MGTILLILLGMFFLRVNSQSPIVEISQGRLQGRVMLNWNNESFYGFQNVPYGRPPINELRFKAPQPADGWDGIRLAISDGIRCIQHSVLTLGQEDCLYLNIYTRSFPEEEDTLKPVMVWIHGGGFNIGSGSTLIYGPEFIMTEDVVLVTINYRLGMFGGFSVDDPNLGVTGNIGLKDQSLALRWVKENVRQFSGDPENILIFGESAGGMSVHLHMLSPMSAGYFDKVIAQSGNGIMDFVNGRRNNGLLLAEHLGVSTTDLSEMLTELQELPASTILSAALELSARYRYFTNPLAEVESSEPVFLPDVPIRLLERGEYNHVPILMGINDAEGLLFQIEERISNERNVTVDDFRLFVPIDLNLDPESNSAINLMGRIKNFYYGDEEPTQANITPTIHLHTDFSFAFSAVRAGFEHFRTMTEPVYFYFFTADTSLNILKHIDETTTNFPGAAHADELGYLFHNDLIPVEIEEGSLEEFGLVRMVKLWTNFARYTNPTPPSEDLGYTWQPIDDDFKYLHLDTSETTMVTGIPLEERMRFWFDIYDEYWNPQK